MCSHDDNQSCQSMLGCMQPNIPGEIQHVAVQISGVYLMTEKMDDKMIFDNQLLKFNLPDVTIK